MSLILSVVIFLFLNSCLVLNTPQGDFFKTPPASYVQNDSHEELKDIENKINWSDYFIEHQFWYNPESRSLIGFAYDCSVFYYFTPLEQVEKVLLLYLEKKADLKKMDNPESQLNLKYDNTQSIFIVERDNLENVWNIISIKDKYCLHFIVFISESLNDYEKEKDDFFNFVESYTP